MSATEYHEFDVAGKESSDRLAGLLRAAGIRFEQRALTETRRRPVYSISVHPEDVAQADELRAEDTRREKDAFVRTLHLVRRPYGVRNMLVALKPNEDGLYASCVYDGAPFDPTRYRVVGGGWDHEHCLLCWANVQPGDEWWATNPASMEDEFGLCLDCYSRLFG